MPVPQDTLSLELNGSLPLILGEAMDVLAQEAVDRVVTRLTTISSKEATSLDLLDCPSLRLEALRAFKDGVTRRVDTLERQTMKQLNSLRPIHRLPTEIFTRILLFTSEKWSQPATWLKWKPSENYNLALVSTHWRDVILHTPGFWSVIYFDDPKSLQDIILQRNPHASISIRCDRGDARIPVKEVEEFMSKFQDNPRRVKSLNFGGYMTEASWDVIRPFLPTVKDLNIDDCGGLIGVDRFVIPGDLPLRHAIIEGVSPNWSSNRFAGMQSLVLWGIPIMPSKNRLHAMLSACPDLTLLLIEEIEQAEQDPEPGPTPTSLILLLKLESLVLLATPEDVSDFLLSRLAAPKCERVICRSVSVKPLIETPSPFGAIVQDVFKLIKKGRHPLTLYLEEPDANSDDTTHLFFTLQNESRQIKHMDWENFRYWDRDPEIFLGCSFRPMEWSRIHSFFSPVAERITTVSFDGRDQAQDFNSSHIPAFLDPGCLDGFSLSPVERLDFAEHVNFKPLLEYIREPRSLPNGDLGLPFPKLHTISLILPIDEFFTPMVVEEIWSSLASRNMAAVGTSVSTVWCIRVSKHLLDTFQEDRQSRPYTIEGVDLPYGFA